MPLRSRPCAPPEPGIRLRGRVSQRAVDHAAAIIAAQLVDAAAGAPPDLPSTWKTVARARGIDLAPHRIDGEALGAYYPDGPRGRPVIVYDARLSRRQRVRVLIHELAHDVLEGWQPPRLPGLADTERYDDDREGVAHRIARAVERLVVG